MEKKRYFTVEEANRCIPFLTQDILALQSLKSELQELHVELTPLFEVISSNGGDKKTPLFLRTAEQFRQTLKRVTARGCHLKGLEPGLVDFPHLRQGKEVYLCWQFGESEIRYWHKIDTGFSGRKPL